MSDCPGTCTCGHPTACPVRAGVIDLDAPTFSGLLVITPEEHAAVIRLINWVDASLVDGPYIPSSIRHAVIDLERLRPVAAEVGR